jgi:hypothetical protein
MERVELVQYPVVEVSIGGSAVDKQPSRFTLITDQGLPSVMAKLVYPADTVTVSAGDPIIVSLIAGEEKNVLFTGAVCDAKTHGPVYELALTDGYKKLCETIVTPAYRKEIVKAILQDILDAAGITDTKITCPSVTLGRFSTSSISAAMSIKLLIAALEEHGASGLRFFFDADNVFHFGTGEDTGKNEGEAIALETGKNIIKTGTGHVAVLPLPIRHSQAITIDGTAMETIRTDLTVSGYRSRLVLWVKEV